MADHAVRTCSLGIDFGTSHTVAVIASGASPARPLLFDGSPLMPSAVFATTDGELLVGRYALQNGRRVPASLEPHPKRRVDSDSILLGEREIDTVKAIAAVLSRVAREAERVGGKPTAVTITVPANWGPTRKRVVASAAERAGLGPADLVPEPVAAATYFAHTLGHAAAEGQAMIVYDLGAGTFDASVVARRSDGFEVLAVDGRDDLGGLDIDAALLDHVGAQLADHPDWKRLSRPSLSVDARHRQVLVEEIRIAKENLSTYTQAEFTIPLVDMDIHLTRAELEDLARPILSQTVRVTQAVIEAADIPSERTAGVFLVGGGSRIPLAATMLHQSLGIAPTAIEQPELVVAEGALHAGRMNKRSEPAAAPAPHSSSPPIPVRARPREYQPETGPAPMGPTSTPSRRADEAGPPEARMPKAAKTARALLWVQAVVTPLWFGLSIASIERIEWLWSGDLNVNRDVRWHLLAEDIGSNFWELAAIGSLPIALYAAVVSAVAALKLKQRSKGARRAAITASAGAALLAFAHLISLPEFRRPPEHDATSATLILVLAVGVAIAIIINLTTDRSRIRFGVRPGSIPLSGRRPRPVVVGQALLFLQAFPIAPIWGRVAWNRWQWVNAEDLYSMEIFLATAPLLSISMAALCIIVMIELSQRSRWPWITAVALSMATIVISNLLANVGHHTEYRLSPVLAILMIGVSVSTIACLWSTRARNWSFATGTTTNEG